MDTGATGYWLGSLPNTPAEDVMLGLLVVDTSLLLHSSHIIFYYDPSWTQLLHPTVLLWGAPSQTLLISCTLSLIPLTEILF